MTVDAEITAPRDETPGASLALPALLEALLFVSPSPAPIARLAQAAQADEAAVTAALAELAEKYGAEDRGLRMIRKDRKSVV